MTQNERQQVILTKLNRARSHYQDLKIHLQSFLDSNPYRVEVKHDPETRRNIYYVAGVRPTPILITNILGDLIQNLRSSLDHLAYQLVHAGTNGAGPFKNTYFPISEDSTKFVLELSGRTKGMSQTAIDKIVSLQPYNGGISSVLWQLHKLNITDKHRSIFTVGSAFQSVNIAPVMHRHMEQINEDSPIAGIEKLIPNLFIKPADNLFPLKVNDELFIDEPDAEANQKFQFRFNVVFGEQVVAGQPILSTSQNMISLVEKITTDFKSLL